MILMSFAIDQDRGVRLGEPQPPVGHGVGIRGLERIMEEAFAVRFEDYAVPVSMLMVRRKPAPHCHDRTLQVPSCTGDDPVVRKTNITELRSGLHGGNRR